MDVDGGAGDEGEDRVYAGEDGGEVCRGGVVDEDRGDARGGFGEVLAPEGDDFVLAGGDEGVNDLLGDLCAGLAGVSGRVGKGEYVRLEAPATAILTMMSVVDG